MSGFLYSVLEANLIHQHKNEIDGKKVAWDTAFSVPGLQYVTSRWVVEGIIQLPAVQVFSGSALEDDFIARAGFRFIF